MNDKKGSKLNESLITAVEEEDSDKCLLYLRRGADPFDRSTARGAENSAFLRSVWKGRLDIVQLMLNHGGDAQRIREKVNEVDGIGDGALGKAAFISHPKLVKLLIENGADANHRCNLLTTRSTYKRSNSPLIIAAKRSSEEVIEILLSQGGADINYESDEVVFQHFNGSRLMRSALVSAIQARNQTMVNLLLSYGANLQSIFFSYVAFMNNLEFEDEPFRRVELSRWPMTMVIILFLELGIFTIVDGYSLIDLNQFLG